MIIKCKEADIIQKNKNKFIKVSLKEIIIFIVTIYVAKRVPAVRI